MNAPIKKTFLVGTFMQLPKNNMQSRAVQPCTLKYGSEEKGSSLCKCSIFLDFLMSKKQERLRSELLSEHKITNLLGFLT